MEMVLPLNASLPAGKAVPGGDPQPPGIPIQFVSATMKAGLVKQTKKVMPDEQDIRFTFDLAPGEFRMQTWLEDAEGITRGAYYVYATRIE